MRRCAPPSPAVPVVLALVVAIAIAPTPGPYATAAAHDAGAVASDRAVPNATVAAPTANATDGRASGATVTATTASVGESVGERSLERPGVSSSPEGVVVGRPSLEVYAPDNRVVSGERVTLDVFVSNAGIVTRAGPAQYEARVMTARNLRIDVLDEEFPEGLAGNVEVLTGGVPVGTVPQGTAGPFRFAFEVDEDIEPGTYEIPVQLSYDYTWFVQYSDFEEPEYTDTSREVDRTLTLVVRERPRFEVQTGQRVVTPGDATSRTFTVTNTGGQRAVDATLDLTTGEGPLSFGSSSGDPTAQVALGNLAPGESTTVSVRVGAPADLPPGSYPLTATVSYRSETGIGERSRSVSVAVPVGAEQTFAVTDVTDSLQVGGAGTVSGTVVNTGGQTVSNAVVVFPGNATGLRARSGEYAVGTLAPGESASFEFVVDAANGTTDGPRVLPLAVRYRNPADEVRVSEAVDAPVTVDGEQTFDVRFVESDLRVAGSGTVVGTVVNTGNRTVTDAVVVFESSGGIQARETQYPVGTLAPGESAQFRLPVDVSSRVDAGPQFVSFRVRYRGEEDEVRRSGTIDATVRVGPEQSFDVRGVDSTLQVGETGAVRGTVVNTGDRTVTDAVVVFGTNVTGIASRTREVAVGTLAPGESAPFSFTADVPRLTDAGDRPVLFRVRYRDANDETRTSGPIDAMVRVASEQSFALDDVETTLRVGERGRVVATVRNTGTATVDDVRVVYTGDGALQPLSKEAAAGTLAPGETATVAFTFDISRDGDSGGRTLPFVVRYEGRDGEVRTSAALSLQTAVAGEQTFAVANVSSTLRVDDVGTVTARVVNTGEIPVDDVVVSIREPGATLVPRETESAVGSLAPGENATVEFVVDVAGDAEPGTRLLALQVRYRGQDGRVQTTDDVDATVRVAAEQSFALDDVETTLRVGERGRVVATVRNTGTEAVDDVRVVYTGDGALQPLSSEAAAGTLAPGETATVAFTFDVPRDVDPGRRTLPFVVRYQGRDDEPRTSAPLSLQTAVAGEQTFAVANVSSTLRVDDTGTVSARLVNTGEIPVDDVVVSIREPGPTLVPRETDSAVGSLAPGENATVEFRFDVTADAEPGARLLDLQVRYRGQGGRVQTTDDVDATVRVSPQRDEFAVTAGSATVPAGDTRLVTVRVRNLENETLRDVRARLFVDDPLGSDSSEAYVQSLAPNETATLTFEVSADAGAVPKQYPLLVDFTYEDERGESVLSDTYFVPVDVAEPESREFPIPSAAAALVVLLAVAGLYWKRDAVASALGR